MVYILQENQSKPLKIKFKYIEKLTTLQSVSSRERLPENGDSQALSPAQGQTDTL